MNLRDRQERLRIALEDQWARLSPGARKRVIVAAAALPVLIIAAVVLNLFVGGGRRIETRSDVVTFEGGENPAFAIDLERLRGMPVEAVREELNARRSMLSGLGRSAPAEQLAAADAAVRRAETVLAERGG